MGRIVGNGRGGGVQTPKHTTLELVCYPIVQQCTTRHVLRVIICRLKGGANDTNNKIAC